jgi:hypothetical protein
MHARDVLALGSVRFILVERFISIYCIGDCVRPIAVRLAARGVTMLTELTRLLKPTCSVLVTRCSMWLAASFEAQ